MPPRHLLAALALAALAGCRTTPAPAASVAQTSAYVVMLGRDTIAVEQFTRVGDRLEGALAMRAPRTTITRYAVTLNPDGSPAHVDYGVRLADGTLVPGAARGVTMTFLGDSAVTRVQRDSVLMIRTRAPGAFPYVNYGVAFYQMPLDAMRAAGRDSLVTAVLPVGSRATTPLTLRRAGTNRWTADLFGYRYDVRTDDRGIVQTVDGTGTTQQFLITRRQSLDVAAVAAGWAERERQTQAMGILSPRDTAIGVFHGDTVFVDYSRPSARGRTVFAANGVLNDTLWRTGANAATQLWARVPIRIGGAEIPAGKYTLWTLAVPGRYQLIVNKQVGQWGTIYDPTQDLVRVPLAMSPVTQHVERFTIALDAGGTGGGALRMRWATTELSVPISVP